MRRLRAWIRRFILPIGACLLGLPEDAQAQFAQIGLSYNPIPAQNSQWETISFAYPASFQDTTAHVFLRVGLPPCADPLSCYGQFTAVNLGQTSQLTYKALPGYQGDVSFFVLGIDGNLQVGISGFGTIHFGPAYYVRPGASGAKNGANWNDAFPDLPTSLQRNALYYLAEGSYAGHTFQDPPDAANSTITVRKATQADHGTSVGWSAAFGDGQAIVSNAQWVFSESRYFVDGATGSGTSGHGLRFEIDPPSTANVFGFGLLQLLSYSKPITDITIRRVEVDGGDSHPPGFPDSQPGSAAFYAGSNFASGTNITLSEVYFHDLTASPILIQNLASWTLERSVLARNRSTPQMHASGVCVYNATSAIFRYNRFEDIEGTGIITVYSPSGGVEVYGNLFLGTANPNYVATGISHGTVSDNFSEIQGLLFYNNTIVGLQGLNSGVSLFSATSTGGLAYDNLFYNNAVWARLPEGSQGFHDYNSLLNTQYAYGTNPSPNEVQTNSGSPDPFVDSSAMDFHLNGPTAPGLPLPLPYRIDPDGILRGADGLWDHGAYEFR